eukprot:207144-Chlamydomonas_euryale.AAC.12
MSATHRNPVPGAGGARPSGSRDIARARRSGTELTKAEAAEGATAGDAAATPRTPARCPTPRRHAGATVRTRLSMVPRAPRGVARCRGLLRRPIMMTADVGAPRRVGLWGEAAEGGTAASRCELACAWLRWHVRKASRENRVRRTAVAHA